MRAQTSIGDCKGSRIKITQVREWLLDNIRENMDREVRVTLNIWSTPGVGKTFLSEEAAKILSALKFSERSFRVSAKVVSFSETA